MQVEQIALQLYTLREPAGSDAVDTLRRVADMGYRAVELAGSYDMTAVELRSVLDVHGLRAIAAHVRLAEFENNLPGVIGDAQTLGCDYVLVPWVGQEWRGNLAVARRLAAALGRFGAACHAAGLGFAYHHHDFEFAPLVDSPSGQSMFDIIVSETDPALVALEVDVYWAAFAGIDPSSLLHRLAGRVPLLHAKDLASDDQRSFAVVGEGTLDWPAILTAAASAGVRWLIVEHDQPRDPFGDAERALRNLANFVRRTPPNQGDSTG